LFFQFTIFESEKNPSGKMTASGTRPKTAITSMACGNRNSSGNFQLSIFLLN